MKAIAENCVWKSNSDEWETPQELFESLDREFHFNIDACASDENHKCEVYYTQSRSSIEADWGGRSVFCNPPYSEIKRWVEKCFRESRKDNTTVVLLLPSRTDTRYFHDFILNRSEIRFIKGRLHFNNTKNPAPFPSMIVIYRGAYV